MFNKNI